MNRETAQRISGNLLEASRLMNEAALVAKEHATEEEFVVVRNAVGIAMAELLLEVLNRLYRDHPDLKPEGFD